MENFVFCYNPDWFHPKPGAPSTGSPIASATKYFNAMESLLRVIHRISAYALNLPDVEFFNRFYFGRQNIGAEELDEDGRAYIRPKVLNGSALRFSRYFPLQATPLEMERGGSANDASSDSCMPETNIDRDEKILYGAHTDYQGYTILRPDLCDWKLEGARGLQVQHPITSSWMPVKIPDNISDEVFVINVGDLFQRWTNDRWISANHRY